MNARRSLRLLLLAVAKCRPIAGPDTAECECSVGAGPSAGQTSACGRRGLTMASRYHPVSAYQICTSNTTWAQCLDVNCTISSTNATG